MEFPIKENVDGSGTSAHPKSPNRSFAIFFVVSVDVSISSVYD
jgi:hypothetical protein